MPPPARLGALNVSKNEKRYRDNAIKNINDAQSDVTRGRLEQAIRELTAADFVPRITSADPAAARQAIDRLLRDVECAGLSCILRSPVW